MFHNICISAVAMSLRWPVGLLFSLYSYIKHLKNLFVRNHWTDFNITWQTCSFGDPLSSFSSIRHDALKNMAARGWVGGGGGGRRVQGYKIYTKILEQ